MSRSGYSDFDIDSLDAVLAMGRWKAMLRSAMRGRRGQQFLRDLRDALDAMPVKRLISSELKNADGEVCAIGSVGVRRGVDMSELCYQGDGSEQDRDYWHSDMECNAEENAEILSAWFDIALCLVQDVVHENDDCGPHSETPEQRWVRMRKWVERKLTGGRWNPNAWPWDADGRPVEAA